MFFFVNARRVKLVLLLALQWYHYYKYNVKFVSHSVQTFLEKKNPMQNFVNTIL